RSLRDWSSDVCSSDLQGRSQPAGGDLDLGQLGHASKPRPRLASAKRPLRPTKLSVSSFTRAYGPGEHQISAPLTRPRSAYPDARSEERRVGKECRAG